MMSNRAEKSYPYVLAAISGGVTFFVLMDRPLPENLKDLLSAIINVSAIAIGFLATAKSILISIQGSRIIRQLRSGGGVRYNQLIDYMMIAIYSCFGLAILSTIGLLMDLKASEMWHTVAAALWFGCLVLSGLTCQRVIMVFTKILKSPE